MDNESKPPMRQIAELIDGIATARAEDATALLRIAEMQAIEARLGEKAALETIADRDAQIARVKALLDSAISDCIDRDAEIARLKAALDSESTLRSYRDEQLRLLHQDYAGCVGERNEARHEVETWQREYSGALADFEHAQAEIARLKDHVDAASETAGNAIREVIDLRRANAQLDAGIARLEAELSEALFGVAERQKTIDVMLESRKRDHAELAAERDRTTATVTCSRVVPTATEIRACMSQFADQPRTGGYVPPPASPADDPRIAALCRVVAWAVDRQWSYTVQHCPTVRADLETIAGNR